jgi:DNA polymerase
VLVAADSSQIEARLVAWLAGQTDLLQAFREKRDVYSEFASEVYGRTITKADKIERFVGKTCVLGLGYGMGAEKFRRTLEIGQGGVSVKIDISEAERIVRLYRTKNHKIVSLWNQCGNALTQMLQGGSGSIGVLDYDTEGISLPNKFRIKYPALRQTTNGFEYIGDARSYRKAVRERVTSGDTDSIPWIRIYGGKVTENLVQALAALVIREQMVNIGKHYHVVFQVHDEIIITAPEDKAKDAQLTLEAVMFTPPRWAQDLPVACESGFADNYGDT